MALDAGRRRQRRRRVRQQGSPPGRSDCRAFLVSYDSVAFSRMIFATSLPSTRPVSIIRRATASTADLCPSRMSRHAVAARFSSEFTASRIPSSFRKLKASEGAPR